MGPTLQSNDVLAEMHHLLCPTALGHPVHPWCPLLSWPRRLLTSRSGDSGGQSQTRVTVFFCVCLCCSACILTHCLPLRKKFPHPPQKRIIESVGSINRDERGFPLTQYITNGRISRARYTITHFKHHHRVLRLIFYRMSVYNSAV